MQLIEIKGLVEIETGGTCPVIITSDFYTALSFYKQYEEICKSEIEDQEVYSLIFNPCIYYKFGSPSNETISGHPYYDIGLRSFSFYEVKNSDLISSLKEIESSHEYYQQDGWSDYKHFILTFHDNMFECVSKTFEIRVARKSPLSQATLLLSEISAKYQ